MTAPLYRTLLIEALPNTTGIRKKRFVPFPLALVYAKYMRKGVNMCTIMPIYARRNVRNETHSCCIQRRKCVEYVE